MIKLQPKINWIPFDKNNPPRNLCEDTPYLIFLREKYHNDWEYSMDIATPYGSYLDDFWDTEVDWKEGQPIEVLAYAELHRTYNEDELKEKQND